MREVYERNAIVVVPSRGEGFGMVALEAAERGRAAIVTDVGGLPEIVADGETGLVVPAGGRAGAGRGDRRARGRPERVRRYGAAARGRALEQFSPLLPPTVSRACTASCFRAVRCRLLAIDADGVEDAHR